VLIFISRGTFSILMSEVVDVNMKPTCSARHGSEGLTEIPTRRKRLSVLVHKDAGNAGGLRRRCSSIPACEWGRRRYPQLNSSRWLLHFYVALHLLIWCCPPACICVIWPLQVSWRPFNPSRSFGPLEWVHSCLAPTNDVEPGSCFQGCDKMGVAETGAAQGVKTSHCHHEADQKE